MSGRIQQSYTYRLGTAVGSAILVTIVVGLGVGFWSATADVGAIQTTAVLLFVSVMDLGLLGIVIGGDVTTELRQLRHVTEEIGEGNLDVAVTSPRTDELGQLTGGLNMMRTSLQSAFADLEAAQEEAEQAPQAARRDADQTKQEAEEFNQAILEAAENDGTPLRRKSRR